MHSACKSRQQMSVLFTSNQQFQTEWHRVIICLLFKIPNSESLSEIRAAHEVGDSKWLGSSCIFYIGFDSILASKIL